MAVNKNFVVKNGLEVNDDLILANAVDSMVGIGTSVPYYELHVQGGIGATSLWVAGVSTFTGDVQVSGVTTLSSAGGITTTGGDIYVGGEADDETILFDNEYTPGNGWDQICWTFSTNQENWDSGEALVIQARLYSSSSGPDPTKYYIDLVEVTAPNSATVNYPGTTVGCTDSSAENYIPSATIDNGACNISGNSI